MTVRETIKNIRNGVLHKTDPLFFKRLYDHLEARRYKTEEQQEHMIW